MRAPCRAATAQRPLLSAPTRPKLEAERTDFGLRNYAIREAGDGRRYVRINNFIMPNKVAAVGNEGRVSEGYTIHWRVPVDDESHIRFDVYFNRVRPVARQRYEEEVATEIIDNRYRRNKRNRYLQDREQMKTGNFAGMGDHYAVHDAFAAESAGAIHDRSREHLGTSGTCIVAARRQLLAAIASVQSGRDPIHVIRDAAENDLSHIVVLSEVVAPGDDPKELWKSRRQLPAAASGATRACRRSRVG